MSGTTARAAGEAGVTATDVLARSAVHALTPA
jgi:hypothetical protein